MPRGSGKPAESELAQNCRCAFFPNEDGPDAAGPAALQPPACNRVVTILS
jgi:hypothetical protein